MSFANKVLTELNLFGVNIWITQTHVGMIIVMTLIIGFILVVNSKLKKFAETDVPTGFQNFVELLIEFFESFVKSSMGEKNVHFTPYYMTIFFLIVLSNISGIFGLRPPTADYGVPMALALITFTMIHFLGIKHKGIGGYLNGYLQPVAVLAPLNVIGEMAIPISLSFRLFGNLAGGTILLGLYYELLPWFMKLGFPVVLHFYFDLFAGVVQSFVFIMLSMVFVSNAVDNG